MCKVISPGDIQERGYPFGEAQFLNMPNHYSSPQIRYIPPHSAIKERIAPIKT